MNELWSNHITTHLTVWDWKTEFSPKAICFIIQFQLQCLEPSNSVEVIAKSLIQNCCVEINVDFQKITDDLENVSGL